jgi:2TM domain
MDNDQDYRRARQKVRSIRGFYIHLIVFVLVMAFLLIVNLATSPVWWVQWPLFGWGLAVAIHAGAVFGLVGWPDSDWEEKKIKEIITRKPSDKSGP